MNNAQKIALLVLLALYAILPLFLKNYGIYLMTLLCVYLMAAFGLNLIVGYAGQMSIGQAAFYGIGAYIAGILMVKMGISFWLVLPIAAVACFAIGLALGDFKVSYADIGTLLMAGLIVIGLQLFLNRTVTGRAMQAVAQNTDAAKVLGINVQRMVLYVFLINAVLAVVAALLVTPTYLAKFDMGESIGLKAFYAAIIGGFNQTRGALLGGVLVGVLENLTGAYISPAYKEGVALLLFLVVIIFRPEGLLGKAEERKV